MASDDQSCNLFIIMIENLLHFLEYLDDKVNSMKDFPLHVGFVKSTIHSLPGTYFLVFWTNAEKFEWEDCANILRSAILNLVTWPASLVLWLLVYKNVTGVVHMDHVQSFSSEIAEENIIKLDVSLNR